MSTNKNVVPFDLRSLLDMVKTEVFLSLNCHGVGTIESFDSSAQTAQISMNYNFVINGKESQYPLLIDCPVVILTGGACSLTLPITAGDTCLVIFNDQSIDDWFDGGQVVVPTSARLHSFTDAIALVGIRSTQNALSTYDEDRATLSNGTTSIGVGAAKIRLKNNMTTLNTLLQTLCTDLTTLNTGLTTFASATAGDPIAVVTAAAAAALVPALAAFAASISTLGTQIGGLLE